MTTGDEVVTESNTPLPEGTVTFVFTDIEGSTRLAADHPQGFRAALREHNQVLRDVIAAHGGTEVRTEGDSFFVVFRSSPNAVRFAVATQQALSAKSWPEACDIRVRIGIHTGTGVRADDENDDYVGVHVHRAARIEAAAHGGQIVVSEATKAVAGGDLQEGVMFRDLGLHRLKGFDGPERLYQVVAPGLEEEFPELETAAGVPNNLPADLTTFVGRERVLRDAVKALMEARLLTLTGPGGTGKTRLSIRVGAELIDQFPDGVFFVDLAPVSDASVVAAEVLNAIGIRAAPGISAREMLLHYLSGRSALLILDNLEQIPETADLVASVLQGARDVKVIATSRAALRLRGEREVVVPPLGLPDPESSPSVEALAASEAVALFVDRARDVNPDFELGPETASIVAELVRRLDGLPLAIELAAARVRALPVSAVLERIGPGLLSGGSRDLPERQRTITAAIEWSYDLLSVEARRLFEQFSVFAGGARLSEIEVVCEPAKRHEGDVVDALTELVDQSLVSIPDGASGGRYRMLGTIRDFAQARLDTDGGSEALRDRHLEAYLGVAEQAAPHLLGRNQAQWLDRLAEDHDNLRAALDWAFVRDRAGPALRMCGYLWRFWQIRGHLLEGERRVAEALSLPGGDPRSRLLALEAAGGIAYWMGAPACDEYYAEAVELARSAGDELALADALYNHSFTVALTDHDGALDLLAEARAIYEKSGDKVGLARVQWGVGNVLSYRGDYAGALEAFLSSVEGFEGTDRPFDQGWAHFALAFVLVHSGRGSEEVESSLRRSMRIFLEADDVSGVVMHLAAFAAAARYGGDDDRGYRLAGVMTALRDELGFGLVDTPENAYPGLSPDDLAQLEGHAATAFEQGRRMALDEAVSYALREIDVKDTP